MFALLGDNFQDNVFHKRHLIRIYDVERKFMRYSSVKCPIVEGHGQLASAMTMRNEKSDEMIVYGFVRRCFAEYKDMAMLPKYLTQLLYEWICNDYIHLVSRTD